MSTNVGINSKVIKKGMWVNFTPFFVDGFCDSPREVSRVTESRVYYIGKKTGDEHWKAFSSVVFVSDTEAEADEFYALSMSQFTELRKVRAEHEAKVAAILALSGITSAKYRA